MKAGDISHTHFSDLDKDFKAEVIAAEMAEHGIDADRILILMTGPLKRPFSKDVESVEEAVSEHDHKEYTIIKTPREGLYDMLPEGLFHHPSAHKSATSDKEVIKAMKQRRIEEHNARKFFLPFEASINYVRMQMASYENLLDKRSHYPNLVDVFSGYWEIFKHLDARQANIFLHLIPILHDLRDDYPATRTVMEMIFLLPVHIALRNQQPLHPAMPILSIMGDSTLGVDLTTGNAVYDEGVDEILLHIGPMPNDVFQQFRQGGTNQKILEILCDYLLPVHMDTITEFELDKEDRITRLADAAGDFNSALGTDTYL